MKFLTILISTIISLLFIEIFTRILIDDGMNYEIEMMKYAKNMKVISENKEIGIEHKKNSKSFLMGAKVELNNYGFRNSKISENSRKILMLGDSMTFGWGAKYPFPNILNDRLNKFEVINAGIGNTNTNMQVNNFFSNFKDSFKYEVIILNFFINDFEKVHVKKPNFLRKNSYFFTYVSNTVNQLLVKFNIRGNWQEFYDNSYNDLNFRKKTFSNILKLKNYCDRNNIKFVIHNIPELRNLKDYKFKRQTEDLKKFAQDNNISFVNSYNALKKYNEEDLWVSLRDPHANDKAHLIIANFLFQNLNQYFN